MNIREPERHISYYDDALVCFDVEINKNEQKRENYNKRNKKKLMWWITRAHSSKRSMLSTYSLNFIIMVTIKMSGFFYFFICIEFLLPK